MATLWRHSPRMSETQIVRSILEALAVRGIFAYRSNTGGSYLKGKGGRAQFVRFGLPGAADITGILPDGRRLEIEVKTPKGKLTDRQIAFGERITENRGVWFVARSVDEALALLDAAIKDGARSAPQEGKE